MTNQEMNRCQLFEPIGRPAFRQPKVNGFQITNCCFTFDHVHYTASADLCVWIGYSGPFTKAQIKYFMREFENHVVEGN